MLHVHMQMLVFMGLSKESAKLSQLSREEMGVNTLFPN